MRLPDSGGLGFMGASTPTGQSSCLPACLSAYLPFTCSRLHAEGAETALPPHCLPPEVRLCGKLELLDRLLVKLRAGGHKVSARGPVSLATC